VTGDLPHHESDGYLVRDAHRAFQRLLERLKVKAQCRGYRSLERSNSAPTICGYGSGDFSREQQKSPD
jgi:hypothetical protein